MCELVNFWSQSARLGSTRKVTWGHPEGRLGPPEKPLLGLAEESFGFTRKVSWAPPEKKLGPDHYVSRDRTRGHTEGARASSDPLRKGAISFFVSDIYI